MATTTPSSSGPSPSVEPDWPAQAADAIVDGVGKVRDKTAGPAIKIARYVVFGAFAAFLGTVALIILLIGTVRAVDAYLPDAWFGETHTWAAHTIIGAVLCVFAILTGRKWQKAANRR